ncbi:hypothetical protein [Chamaesiphon minutus]|uniref:Uncharacterized protein n=1 Tax=Chamaesiphon minutus (strain ATCC 27169 / PCC 6605) TaxID=1173020 RepID=K9UMQ4_CHAP6|nr:hypothetical protein [Chamaesiphon minutus]AFY95938.1 hypothetical protein Cha6605_5034 [Chamaesiphon minutus PCC 6605]
MMSVILTVSELTFSTWIDAIYRATHSIVLPAKIPATQTRLVQIENKPSQIALHPNMLDAGQTIDYVSISAAIVNY